MKHYLAVLALTSLFIHSSYAQELNLALSSAEIRHGNHCFDYRFPTVANLNRRALAQIRQTIGSLPYITNEDKIILQWRLESDGARDRGEQYPIRHLTTVYKNLCLSNLGFRASYANGVKRLREAYNENFPQELSRLFYNSYFYDHATPAEIETVGRYSLDQQKLTHIRSNNIILNKNFNELHSLNHCYNNDERIVDKSAIEKYRYCYLNHIYQSGNPEHRNSIFENLEVWVRFFKNIEDFAESINFYQLTNSSNYEFDNSRVPRYITHGDPTQNEILRLLRQAQYILNYQSNPRFRGLPEDLLDYLWPNHRQLAAVKNWDLSLTNMPRLHEYARIERHFLNMFSKFQTFDLSGRSFFVQASGLCRGVTWQQSPNSVKRCFEVFSQQIMQRTQAFLDERDNMISITSINVINRYIDNIRTSANELVNTTRYSEVMRFPFSNDFGTAGNIRDINDELGRLAISYPILDYIPFIDTQRADNILGPLTQRPALLGTAASRELGI